MKRYSFGNCPPEVITRAVYFHAPSGYQMTIRSQSEWKVIAEVWNQGIDSHLEAMTERSDIDSHDGEILIHPEELKTFLRRLFELGTDEAWSIRSGILSTLEIEEI